VSLGLSVWLLDADGEPTVISGGHREISVDVEGETPVALGTMAVPVGAYSGVRVAFTHIEATVTSGLVGLDPLAAVTVTVDLEGAPAIEVERTLGVTVEDGDHVVATVDLRSQEWIGTVALAAVKVVPAAVFRSVVHLTLEGP
jgi:hypothetical protein